MLESPLIKCNWEIDSMPTAIINGITGLPYYWIIIFDYITNIQSCWYIFIFFSGNILFCLLEISLDLAESYKPQLGRDAPVAY